MATAVVALALASTPADQPVVITPIDPLEERRQEFKRRLPELYPSLLRTCTRMVGSAAAEDLVQDAFLKGWHSLGSFRGESNLKTWLRRILLNEVFMTFRPNKWHWIMKASSEFEVDEESVVDHAELPDVSLEREELRLVALQCLEALPELYRSVCRMRYAEGLDVKEVAWRMGMSVPAVKSRLLRGRLMMRARWIEMSRSR